MEMKNNGAAFVLRDITRDYVSREGTCIKALNGVSFEAAVGKITCLIGPTGSGKSTILRIVAGLESPDSGTVWVGGAGPGGQTGKVGYLTQRHTLFPWMTVWENMGLPLEIRRVSSRERTRRVEMVCEMLGLKDAIALYPYELSGGMQQRAALGRLLLSETPYWLMDEPFSALDDRTHHQLQRLILGLVKEHALSLLFVTHSIDEAVFLADRIVLLSAGPGRVVETFDVESEHPRDRLSSVFGQLIEKIRRSMEAVILE